MHYAYIRVSSVDQHVDRQKEALSASGIEIDKIYIEQASAKNINRPQLQDMLQQVRTGDTIVVHSIDRLCRNMMDMCTLTLRLREQGITLIFLKEPLTFSANESTPMQELQLHMMSAFSQFERALIRERQTEGIAAKKQRGERTGRPPAEISKLPQIDALRSKGIKLKLACDNVGLGVSTYYKLRHQLKNGEIR
ncbi:recombinase family protein [Photorhabdus hindustanensis]|uniref:Resolvase n=1 Tax=Photorhabdus hindustanensis TaxID=2918802 RepID=A0A2S8PY17_9GAMM|nr:recombinase family protein [Photorhabdus hindustanensis]PQQ23985.1 resolvase [Photorhabdus hindustanensis]